MLSIKRDAVLHLERGHVYSRDLLHDVFARAREIVKKDESRTIFPVEENGRQLFSLQYEKNYVRVDEKGPRAATSPFWTYDFLNGSLDVLDLTLLRRFDALVFSRLEEYSFAIAELVLRSLPSIRLYATDELWKNFFTGEEVTFLHDWRDYQVLGDESTCFIDSDEAIQPGYKEGTKCRRYNSVNVMMSILWACNVEKLGDENPREKILLLDYATESAGLVDIIQFTYVYAHMARERGWVPVVLLDKKPNQYLEKNGENMWEYFFRRVSLLTPESALRSAQVVRASTNHMRLNQYTQNPYQRELFDRVLEWLQSYNQGDFHGIVRMNPSVEYGILKHVQATLGSDKNILGVMCRGTDFSSEFTPRNASPEDMIAATRYYLRKYPIEHIFLATEDEKIYQQFSEAFPGKILSIQQKRVCYDYEKQPWEFVANLLALKDGRAFGLTYLSVLYALSRCRYLIVSMDCGATRGAWALAERPFDIYENINKTKLSQLLFEEKIETAEKKAGHPVLLYQLHRAEEGWKHWNIENRSSLGGDNILLRRLRYDFLKGKSMCVTRHIIPRRDGANVA